MWIEEGFLKISRICETSHLLEFYRRWRSVFWGSIDLNICTNVLLDPYCPQSPPPDPCYTRSFHGAASSRCRTPTCRAVKHSQPQTSTMQCIRLNYYIKLNEPRDFRGKCFLRQYHTHVRTLAVDVRGTSSLLKKLYRVLRGIKERLKSGTGFHCGTRLQPFFDDTFPILLLTNS